MKNRDTQATWKYHDGTKHSYWSIRSDPHFLDWANRPLPFKIYPTIEPLPFPRDAPQTGVAALSAIAQPLLPWSGEVAPDLQETWRVSFISRRELPSSAKIQAEKSTFEPRPARELSTRSNCTL